MIKIIFLLVILGGGIGLLYRLDVAAESGRAGQGFRTQQYFSRMTIEKRNRKCQQSLVSCESDNDCLLHCSEGNVKCIDKKCSLPSSGECNLANGGLNVLSRTDLGQLEFQCVCLFPEYFYGKFCTNQNKSTCQHGGSLQLNALSRFPNVENCTCQNGFKRLTRTVHSGTGIDRDTGVAGGGSVAVPICVKEGLDWVYESPKTAPLSQ